MQTLHRLVGLLLAAGLAATTFALPARADSYKLVAGDTLRISVLGDPERWESSIDLDGALRLPPLGGVAAEGLSLDEVQSSLTEELERSGLHVAPRVSVSIIEYAPIIVSGTVNAPGRFPFAPSLTARAAAGLAGGTLPPGVETGSSGLQVVQISGDLHAVETDMLANALRIARVEAQLADRETVDFDAAQALPFNLPDMALFEHLRSREQSILDVEQSSNSELAEIREIEMQNVERQIELLLERSKVQEDLIRIQEEERVAAEALDERGLRTRMDMARLDRNDASLQAQVLDIEAALSQARTRRADLAGTITTDNANRRRDLLEESAKLRAEMKQLGLKRQTLLAKVTLLGDLATNSYMETPAARVVYTIRRRSDGTVETFEVGPDESILPGDTLEVSFSDRTNAPEEEVASAGARLRDRPADPSISNKP